MLRARAPDRVPAWENIAWAALHLGDAAAVEEARACVAALEAPARATRLIHELDGYLHLIAGRHAETAAALEASLAAGAGGCTVPCLLGLARLRLGERATAARVLSRLRLGPRHARICRNLRCPDVALLRGELVGATA